MSTQFDNPYRRSLALNLIKLPLFTLSRVIFNFFNFVIPISNDAGACQGFLFDTPPWTHWVLTQRHFALVEKVLTSQTKVVTLCNLAVGPQVPPSISSVLAPMILSSNSPLLREAGCPLKRSVSLARPQNDSGSPA